MTISENSVRPIRITGMDIHDSAEDRAMHTEAFRAAVNSLGIIGGKEPITMQVTRMGDGFSVTAGIHGHKNVVVKETVLAAAVAGAMCYVDRQPEIGDIYG